MREIALHILDLAENSVTAGAQAVKISVCEDLAADRLRAMIEDDGKGMDAQTLARVTDPFYTSRTTRNVGLGIPLLKAAAETCNGHLSITSQPGHGTQIEVVFQHSHFDRMPLGNLEDTFLSLATGHPDLHWIFQYSVRPSNEAETNTFEFDDQPIKETLREVPLTHPDVLAFLRDTFFNGITKVRSELVP
ncbi:MAG: sensor histidine kinase [Anaerolineales bacterium]|nr:sensor histidine kinase [Anaerolineales bacterium]